MRRNTQSIKITQAILFFVVVSHGSSPASMSHSKQQTNGGEQDGNPILSLSPVLLIKTNL